MALSEELSNLQISSGVLSETAKRASRTSKAFAETAQEGGQEGSSSSAIQSAIVEQLRQENIDLRGKLEEAERAFRVHVSALQERVESSRRDATAEGRAGVEQSAEARKGGGGKGDRFGSFTASGVRGGAFGSGRKGETAIGRKGDESDGDEEAGRSVHALENLSKGALVARVVALETSLRRSAGDLTRATTRDLMDVRRNGKRRKERREERKKEERKEESKQARKKGKTKERKQARKEEKKE